MHSPWDHAQPHAAHEGFMHSPWDPLTAPAASATGGSILSLLPQLLLPAPNPGDRLAQTAALEKLTAQGNKGAVVARVGGNQVHSIWGGITQTVQQLLVHAVQQGRVGGAIPGAWSRRGRKNMNGW